MSWWKRDTSGDEEITENFIKSDIPNYKHCCLIESNSKEDQSNACLNSDLKGVNQYAKC